MSDTHSSPRARLGRVLEERNLTLTEVTETVGVTLANLSILENDRAKALRFSTFTALCDALDCQPGDIISLD